MSGFLMYGSTQRNKLISALSYAFLAVYLTLTSTTNTLSFLCLNLALIFCLSLLLKRVGSQIISAGSILIYSAIIDIVCYYAIPTVKISLGAYIWQGLLFNLRPALPVFAFAVAVNLAKIVKAKYFSTRKLNLSRGII